MGEATQQLKPTFTPTELAAYFKVTTRTIRNWMKAGCPHRKLGRSLVRFELDAVVQWKQGQETAA